MQQLLLILQLLTLILLLSLLSHFPTFLQLAVLLPFFTDKKSLLQPLPWFSVLQSLQLILQLLRLCLILLQSLVSLFLTSLLPSELLPLIRWYEIATVADAIVFTAVVAATDSTTAKTISNTTNVAGFAIFDVSDVSAPSSTATLFSLLRNHYCRRCRCFHCCSRCY